jgi:hypothetical protein
MTSDGRPTATVVGDDDRFGDDLVGDDWSTATMPAMIISRGR